jgi:membrane fusion protein, multidrug efflux system
MDTISTKAAGSHRPVQGGGALGVALVVVAAAAIGWGLWVRRQDRRELEVRTRELAVRSVSVTTPAPPKPSDAAPLQAEVHPYTEAPIYARASGYVKRWMADIGAKVSEGDLLAELDTPDLDQSLSESRAMLAQSEAALDLARTTANRWAELSKTQSVSQQEAEEKQADLRLKSATVEAGRAAVHRFEDLKRFARVTAPFAGTVTAREIDVGDLVTAGAARVLFRLADTTRLRVFVRTPQAMARDMAPGMEAALAFPELAGRVFKAPVIRNAGAIDPASRTLLIELDLDNAKGEILAGSYAQCRFAAAAASTGVVVPANTLIFRAAGPQLAIVNADSTVAIRAVTIGRDLGTTLEITAGLAIGERVIVNPPDALVDGETVRVITEGDKK